MKLHIARLALLDLQEIRSSSRAHWGARLTRDYLRGVDATMRRIAKRPLQFASLDDLPRYRKARAGQHLIYYIFEDGEAEVRIVRVLHERMDAERHLSRD